MLAEKGKPEEGVAGGGGGRRTPDALTGASPAQEAAVPSRCGDGARVPPGA